MYARVTRNQIRPGKMDETVSLVLSALLPAAKQQPGFKGFFLLTDRQNNRALTISLWDTQEDLDSTSEGSGYFQKYIQRLPDIVGVDNYHVTVQG